MTVLVIGSGGMLGSDLCNKLKEAGYFFIGLDIKSKAEQQLPEDIYLEADITNQSNIENVILDIKPQTVIHAAAYTQVDDCEIKKDLAFKINHQGSVNVARACKKTNSVMFYISTDYVFDGKKTTAYEVNDKVNPLSVYGKSKLEGEEAVRDILKERHIIIRTSWLYGKNGPNFVDKIIARAQNKETLKIINDQKGSPTYTYDLAEGLVELLKFIERNKVKTDLLGTYHITNSNVCSWYDYAIEILKLKEISIKVEAIATDELKETYKQSRRKYAERPSNSVLSNKRFIEVTKNPLRTWQEAIRSYLNIK